MAVVKLIVAIDSFKGCLTSAEANQAAAEGIWQGRPEAKVIQIPVSDGGEGWLEAFHSAMGGELVEVHVKDPLMRPIVAEYLIKDDTAVIEIAKASGLTLLSPEERNPMVATSYGTGQLVVDAVRRGCKHIIVGLGGSATSDCGIGMLRAVIDGFAKHETWDEVKALDDVRFTIATDVTNPLCGEHGAAYVFAPQKFAKVEMATSEMLQALDARARRFAEASAGHFGYDHQDTPGSGAAGGLGYAFLQYMHAEYRSGVDLLLNTIRFDELLKDASLIITGEGSADRQTLMGKLPFGILQRAKASNVPVALIAGRINDRRLLLDAGFSRVDCINPPDLPVEEAMKPETAKRNITLHITTSIQQRHDNMAAIRSKDTKPEMIVRRGLWKRGFRYRLNYKRLPGHPDLVLKKYRTCIFVNGCFWHGHQVTLPQMGDVIENSECCKIPKTNREFWVAKIRRNKERDKEEQRKLAAMGWHCITVWECELKPSKREETLESIAFTLNHIWLHDHQAPAIPYPKLEEEEMQMPMAAEDSQA